jgi:hypothetical protein
MRTRLLVVLAVALWTWVLPIAQAMPIDADGPSGFSDNADFDDLIVGLTSSTAGAMPVLSIVAACFVVIELVFFPRRSPAGPVLRPSVDSRAPPIA